MAFGCTGSDPGDAGSTSPATPPSAAPSPISSGAGGDGQVPSNPSAPSLPEDHSAPYVTSTSPQLGIKSVTPNATIAAQLSEPIAANTVTNQSVKVQDSSGNTVAGTASTDALGLSVQFTPSMALTNGELYSVILTTGITDVSGNTLAQPYAWSFEIAPTPDPPPAVLQDLKPPFVTNTSPELGGIIGSQDLGKALTFTFNEPLAPKNITTNTIHLADGKKMEVAGTVTVDTSTVTFLPSAPLNDSETYTVTLDTSISDIEGNTLTYPYSYNFKTDATQTIAISAGTSTFLALKENGTVWGWGQNSYGQIGDGTQMDRSKPTRTLISEVVAISAGGDFGMALKKDGTVWTWGDNSKGALGDGTTTGRLKPGPVPNLSDIKAISAGWTFAVALKKDGTLWAWGNNKSGQLGIGTTSDLPQTTPVQVQGITGTIKAVTTANLSAAVLVQSDPIDPTSTGIWAWGYNFFGQLGDGTTTNRSLPVQAKLNGAALTNVSMIAFGEGTLAAITATGDLYTWGGNYYGQLGNPDLPLSFAPNPEPYKAMDGVKAVYMGPQARSIYAIKQDGSLWGWGDDRFGQLATLVDGGVQKTPLKLGTISNMNAIASTRQSSIFLQKDGSALTSGYRVNGQLGDGSADYASYRPYYLSNVSTPISSGGALSPTGFSGKDNMVIAAKDGSVWAWGSNQYCEMGVSSKSGQVQPILAPVQVAPTILKNIVEVSRGGFHTLARDNNGNVWAWGDNSYGQLGNKLVSTTPSCTPEKVLNASDTGTLSGITSISAGFLTSFAIQKDPVTGKTTVYAWGINNHGNLGLGSTSVPKPLPVVSPLPDHVKKLASGSSHMLALTESGDVYGWGPNGNYQAGNSTSTADVYTPTKITTASGGPLGPVSDVCVGAYTSFALRSNGTIVGWGMNHAAEALGIDSTNYYVTQPTPVEKITNAVKIACSGGRTNLALTSDGYLWSWGSNIIGNMGVGNTVVYSQPQQVSSPGSSGLFGDVQDISYAVAIRKDGTVWQFGYIPDGNPDFVAHLTNVLWP